MCLTQIHEPLAFTGKGLFRLEPFLVACPAACPGMPSSFNEVKPQPAHKDLLLVSIFYTSASKITAVLGSILERGAVYGMVPAKAVIPVEQAG